MAIRPRLLVAESNGFSEEAANILQGSFDVTFANLSRPELLKQVSDYEYLWTRLANMIDEELFANAPILKSVATNTTGLTHIDLESAARRKIQVISLKGEEVFLRSIRATAELTLGIVLALLRQLESAIRHVKDGGWDRDMFRGTEIFEKRVGIVGYGRLGSIVADYFRTIGAAVSICSHGLKPGSVVNGYEALSLTELCKTSDIVSLHANFEPDNANMISSDQFAIMKPTSVFINTARGELVDENALLSALRSGRIAGAAIDVIANEHNRQTAFEELRNFANESKRLIITPHIGGNCVESRLRTEVFLAKRIVKQFQQCDADHVKF